MNGPETPVEGPRTRAAWKQAAEVTGQLRGRLGGRFFWQRGSGTSPQLSFTREALKYFDIKIHSDWSRQHGYDKAVHSGCE